MQNGRTGIKADYGLCRYSLRWSDTCNTDLYNGLAPQINALHRQDVYMSIGEAEQLRNGSENGFGETIYSFTRKRSQYQISIIATQGEYENLQYINQYGSVKLEDHFDDVDHIIDPASIELQVQGQTFDTIREVLITFAITDSWSVGNECCDSAYDEAPFGTEGFPGADVSVPNEPTPCSTWGAIINTANLPTLSVDETNAPANSTLKIQWFLNGDFKGEGTQLSVGDYGTYTILVTRDVDTMVCIRKDAFIYLNACSLYTIEISVLSGTIGGNVLNVPAGDSQTIEVINDSGVVVSTTLPFTPADPGVYTIKYTSATCGDIMRNVTVVVPEDNTAQHTVTVTNVSGTLTATINNPPGSGTAVYVWIKIDDDKTQSTVGTDSSTYVPAATAYYRVTVSYGADSASDEILFITGLEVKIINTGDSPVITSQISNRDLVILEYAGSGGTQRLSVTGQARDLPNPSLFNSNTSMKTQITVLVNNIEYNYDHSGYDPDDKTFDPSVLGSTQFGIDKATDELVFFETVPAGEDIIISLT